MTQLVVVGAGELARLAVSFLRDAGRPAPIACAVDAEHLSRAALGELPVVPLETLAETYAPDGHEVLVCIGYRHVNRARQEVAERVRAAGFSLATVIHPAAWVSPDAEVGAGTIVFPRAVVEPFAQVGEGCVLWSGSVTAHDSRLGAFCFLAPNATVAGNVTLGDRCFVGANATVRDGLTVAAGCVVGAGALVKRDAGPDTVFPASATEPGRRRATEYDTL